MDYSLLPPKCVAVQCPQQASVNFYQMKNGNKIEILWFGSVNFFL
jgi:hypothetical protein